MTDNQISLKFLENKYFSGELEGWWDKHVPNKTAHNFEYNTDCFQFIIALLSNDIGDSFFVGSREEENKPLIEFKITSKQQKLNLINKYINKAGVGLVVI